MCQLWIGTNSKNDSISEGTLRKHWGCTLKSATLFQFMFLGVSQLRALHAEAFRPKLKKQNNCFKRRLNYFTNQVFLIGQLKQ